MTGCNSSECPAFNECDRAGVNTLIGNYTYYCTTGAQCSSFIPLESESDIPEGEHDE